VGKYLLHCESIENEWPDTKKVDMTLDIRLSRQTRIYEASFNIGVAEGPMKLSTDQDALDQYLADSEGDEDGERDEDGGSDEDEQGDEDEESSEDGTSKLEEDDRTSGIAAESTPTATTAQKRKGSTFASETSKKSKPTSTQRLHLYTAYKSRETGEGVIDYGATSGYLTFKDDRFTTFSASLDLNFTSGKVVAIGRKAFDVGRVTEQWESYSWGAYEYARVARWR